MAGLLNANNLTKAFVDKPLFEGIAFSVNDGERIGLIGPNGSGKSTLIKILAGLETPDDGEVIRRKNLRLGYVAQRHHFEAQQTVHRVAMDALAADPALAHLNDGERAVRVDVLLDKLGFRDPLQKAVTLSGGWQKRLAIAAALVTDPELVLLDEPTNHLDFEGLEWLEKLLSGARFAFLVISHDRRFLQTIPTRIVELDRRYPGGYFSVDGHYADFLERREALLAARESRMESLGNRVRYEVEWLRRGPKARGTKAKGRIDEAHRLMDELETMRSQNTSATGELNFASGGRATKNLLVAKGLSKSLGGRALFRDVDLLLRPKMRLGLVGPNGSGKSTLLRLLADELSPDTGSIRRADGLNVVYFDQKREHLDPAATVRQTLAGQGDMVHAPGGPVHVVSWAKRFRFPPEQLVMTVGQLSGGEQARLLIARLMTREADVLMLDEPTNDLDIPTLEALEDGLENFPGALVLVTHDRHLLDRVSTVVLGLDGEGGAGFFADFEQWDDAMKDRARETAQALKATIEPAAAPAPKKKPTKLSYKEQREFDGMEEAILLAEEELAAAQSDLADPAVATDPTRVGAAHTRFEKAQAAVDALYARWAELEQKQAELAG
ncbi:MAG: ABC-F family ATP-binding cassette domain-containing protein [Deltaproteobacteria bacterium]|nr:ABC-F family ATP-binding cassette domain-containing protein [Deltaproteobacteria bacterium]